MIVKICIVDGHIERVSRLRFICEKVGMAIGEPLEFIEMNENNMNSLVNDPSCIIVFNEDNPWISMDVFVDSVISEGGRSIIIALAKEQKIRFRFLPAYPFALIDTNHYEELIAGTINEAIIKVKDYQ